MTDFVERRRCSLFQIPGTMVRFRRTSFFLFRTGLSKPYPLFDISKGGLAYRGETKFRKNEKVILQLLIPARSPLNLIARVRHQGWTLGQQFSIVGFEFNPFGSKRGCNSLGTLDVLRELDEEFGVDE